MNRIIPVTKNKRILITSAFDGEHWRYKVAKQVKFWFWWLDDGWDDSLFHRVRYEETLLDATDWAKELKERYLKGLNQISQPK